MNQVPRPGNFEPVVVNMQSDCVITGSISPALLGVQQIDIPPARCKAISPTALHTFEDDPQRFVKTYVLGFPREPQTKPMAIGSAFDARIKALLAEQICGKRYWFDELFESQVADVHKEWALPASARVLQQYIDSGALNNLLVELTGHHAEPQFEFTANKDLLFGDGFGVPISGKPDLYFVNACGAKVILDWKVTGFFSQASPKPGYVRAYDEQGTYLGAHKTVWPERVAGIACGNVRLDPKWEDQLCMYKWMMANRATSTPDEIPFILGIEQLVFRPNAPMRVASYRTVIPVDVEQALSVRVRRCWEVVQSGHYFTHLPKEQSDQMVRTLAANRY